MQLLTAVEKEGEKIWFKGMQINALLCSFVRLFVCLQVLYARSHVAVILLIQNFGFRLWYVEICNEL